MSVPTGSARRRRMEISAAQQAAMVRALQAQWAATAGLEVALIETHISFVLIGGARAFKFKKAIRNPFLDDSTLARRRRACSEELRLNRRLAPDLYLGTVNVTGSLARPRFDDNGNDSGDGEGDDSAALLDVAVVMRAFDQAGLWSALAARGELDARHIDALVAQLGPFHDSAAIAPASGPWGTPAQVREPMLDNLQALSRLWPAVPGGDVHRADLAALCEWERQRFARLAPLMAQRLAQGRVRECHGDLHLGNVVQIDGQTTVFDGIEFNDEFRWIDVFSELAFMAMDLHAHGLPRLAHRFVNAWLQHSGDYAGVPLLSYYLVHRALVRAKVALMRVAQPQAPAPQGLIESAEHYLALARQFSRATRPMLMLTHGFSGSGKTTQTQGLLESLGAVRIRADVERKRLAGLGPLERGDSVRRASLYAPEMTERTYGRLYELATPVLQGGLHVVLDATFLRRGQRDAARRLAAGLRVPLWILHFDAKPAELQRRVRHRLKAAADASDADEQVLARQMDEAEPLQDDERGGVICVPWAASPSDTAVAAPVDWSALPLHPSQGLAAHGLDMAQAGSGAAPLARAGAHPI